MASEEAAVGVGEASISKDLGENKGPLRKAECKNGLLRLKVFEGNAKISTKMDFENGCIFTRGAPLTVETTSLGENKGLLR